MELPQLDDYRALFLSDTPMMDVRAPVEYQQGAFPFTQNLPLMNDREREEVGKRYKNMGQDKAIELGHKLVSGNVKAQRVQDWQHFVEQHPGGVLYCFRGGMRSKITQQWIYEKTGIIYPRVKGGYKAMRRYLLDELENSVAQINAITLSGRTGSGKTLFLQHIKQKIDLEGIFHHRGSVFGRHVTPQPPQISIENILSIELLKHLDKGHNTILFEDEGGNIGSRRLPQSLIDKIKQSPLLILDTDLEERVNNTFQEYIFEALAEHEIHYGKQAGFQHWTEYLESAIDRIERRLGGVRHQQLKTQLHHAIQSHRAGHPENHKQWIEFLLTEYYDPMYDYQLSKKQERVIFRGDKVAVSEFLHSEYNLT